MSNKSDSVSKNQLPRIYAHFWICFGMLIHYNKTNVVLCVMTHQIESYGLCRFYWFTTGFILLCQTKISIFGLNSGQEVTFLC